MQPNTKSRKPLFIGIFPTGIGYADPNREEHGDYMKVAFLPFGTLELEIYKPKSPFADEVRAHAAKIQARRGEQFRVSSCGQTVTLGYANLHGTKGDDNSEGENT